MLTSLTSFINPVSPSYSSSSLPCSIRLHVRASVLGSGCHIKPVLCLQPGMMPTGPASKSPVKTCKCVCACEQMHGVFLSKRHSIKKSCSPEADNELRALCMCTSVWVCILLRRTKSIFVPISSCQASVRCLGLQAVAKMCLHLAMTDVTELYRRNTFSGTKACHYSPPLCV